MQSITNNFLQKAVNEVGSIQVESNVKVVPTAKENKKFVTQSVLNFVDLAGSEKVSSHYDNKDPDEIYVMDFGD